MVFQPFFCRQVRLLKVSQFEHPLIDQVLWVDAPIDEVLVDVYLPLNFFHLEDAGMLLIRGVKDISDIQAMDALEQACRLGQSIK